MKEVRNEFIKQFIYGDYIIYIKEDSISYEGYLQNEIYGVISLMIGVPKKQNTLDELIELIENNLQSYINDYKENYEDEEEEEEKMNIKNIAIIKPIQMYNEEQDCLYKSKKGLILVEYEDNSRRYLDIANEVDITDYKHWVPMLDKNTKMEYIFKGDTEYYE